MVVNCREGLVLLKLARGTNVNESEKRQYIGMDMYGGPDRYRVLLLIVGKVVAKIESRARCAISLMVMREK